jgi:hypothetical protein
MVKNDRSRRTFCPEDGRACYTPEGPEPEGFSCANYDLCKSFEGSPALKANPVTAEDVELLRDFFERHIETDEDHALYNRIALALLSSTPSDAATGENDVCDSRQEDAGSGGLQGGANAHTRPLECRGAGEGRNNRPALPASGAARRSDPASEQLDNSDCQLASTPSDTGDELREALTKAIDFLQTAPLESGVCCCGSPVEGHGFGDGHSPVDELRYHASNLAEGLAAALSKAPQLTGDELRLERFGDPHAGIIAEVVTSKAPQAASVTPCEGSVGHSDHARDDQKWCLAAGRYCKHASVQACKAPQATRSDGEIEDWQSIESAPKDGSEILILAHGMAIQARYSPGEWSEDTPINPAEYDGPVWCAFDDAVQFEIEETPEGDFHGPVTHWRPLPEPPARTALNGEGS